MKNTLSEMLEYGPLCAADEELGLYVTVNGAYLNLWVGTPGEGFINTDCRARAEDLYKTTGAEMLDEAKQYLADVIKGDEETEE